MEPSASSDDGVTGTTLAFPLQTTGKLEKLYEITFIRD